MHNPARVDSRRGLKRSWVSSEQQPGPSSSSTAKNKPTSAEKGKTHGGHVKNNPVKTILKVVVSRKFFCEKLYIVKKSRIVVFSHLAGTYYMI